MKYSAQHMHENDMPYQSDSKITIFLWLRFQFQIHKGWFRFWFRFQSVPKNLIQIQIPIPATCDSDSNSDSNIQGFDSDFDSEIIYNSGLRH